MFITMKAQYITQYIKRISFQSKKNNNIISENDPLSE